MDKNTDILGLLQDYQKEIDELDKDKLYSLTSSLDAIISRFFNDNSAYKKDIEYVRKNLGAMVAFKSDKFQFTTLGAIKTFLNNLLDTLLAEISKVGLSDKKTSVDKSINVTVSQNQEQRQENNFVYEIFIDAIKDELTGKQLKELSEIIKTEKEPEKAKSKIFSLIKKYGSDISSNIIANIVTNPAIWSGFIV